MKTLIQPFKSYWGRSAGLLLALTAAVSAPIVTLVGCGSSSSSSGPSVATGRATLTITWPISSQSASRLIPAASNSITVSFLSGTTVVSTQTVARPTSGNTTTLNFPTLPAGALTLQATAYPNSAGSGTPQATASQSVTITAGSTVNLAITMASTISSITLSPTVPSVAVGSTTTLTATPKDSSGATVLTSSTLSYSSSNTSVATISSSGVITGVAAGTATITVAEAESGKSNTATVTVSSTSSSNIVTLANTYISSLSTDQQAVTVVANTAANAAKWSNLPATPSGTLGTDTRRNGVAYSTLTTTQKTAWTNLVQAVLSLNGSTAYNQLTQVRAADYYLGTLNSGYSGDYEYVGFVGTPSTSGTWMLQVGGHHNAHNYYFTGATLNTTTPYHIAVEPTSFTYNGTTYTPLSAQSTAVTNLLKSFSTTQLTSAKLSGNFSDIYLGPGQDARSNFPTGTTGRGILASNLSDSQKTLLKTAIAAWVQKSPLASTYQSLYESELDSTYVAYSGNSSAPTTVFTTQGDYLRIDGPHVWIELACQGGVVIQGQIHYHTIWRDRVTDYNAAYGF